MRVSVVVSTLPEERTGQSGTREKGGRKDEPPDAVNVTVATSVSRSVAVASTTTRPSVKVLVTYSVATAEAAVAETVTTGLVTRVVIVSTLPWELVERIVRVYNSAEIVCVTPSTTVVATTRFSLSDVVELRVRTTAGGMI